MSAGFEKNWVEMLELNKPLAAEGTQARIDQTIEAYAPEVVSIMSIV